eukprot:12177697-Alexandrium_andersonii.AAC.1
MSASLVGSEMCIRDRARTHRTTSRTSRMFARSSRWGASLPPNLAQSPVSYTHLTLPTICSV